MIEVDALASFEWWSEPVPFEIVSARDITILDGSPRRRDRFVFTDVAKHWKRLSAEERRVFPLFYRANLDPSSAYNPLLHRRVYRLGDYPTLFRVFADVPLTPESCLDFANEYGYLGIRGLSLNRAAKRHFAPYRTVSGAESLDQWLWLIAEFKALVALWDAIRTLDAEGLAKSLHWTGHGVHWVVEGHTGDPDHDDSEEMTSYRQLWEMGVDPDDRFGVARMVLRGGLDRRLGRSTLFRPSLEGMPRRGDRLVLYPADLLSAMTMQLADAVIASKDFRRCLECDKWFEASPSTLQANKQFCSASCRMKAYRERQKEAVQLHAQGESVEALAERFESDPATIRNWISKASRRRGRKPAGEGDEQ